MKNARGALARTLKKAAARHKEQPSAPLCRLSLREANLRLTHDKLPAQEEKAVFPRMFSKHPDVGEGVKWADDPNDEWSKRTEHRRLVEHLQAPHDTTLRHDTTRARASTSSLPS